MTTIRSRIKAELDSLGREGGVLIEKIATKDGSPKLMHLEYQKWYSKAMRAVERLAPDRYLEFRRYYEPDPKRRDFGYGNYVIQDFLKGTIPNRRIYPDFDTRRETAENVLNQVAILISISGRVESVLDDLEASLIAHIEDRELLAAGQLLATSPRAAGVLAGVVLETHLQRVAANRSVTLTKKVPTISDLNDALKSAGVFDIPTWRKISFLADVRNICSHKKPDEPTLGQVKDMLDGVSWVLKNAG